MREAGMRGDQSAIPPEGGGPAAPRQIPFGETAAGSGLTAESRPLSKPAGRWAVFIDYDPEKGTREADFLTPADEYVKRFQVRETITPKTGDPMSPQFDGLLMEPVFEGRAFSRWKPVRITGGVKDARHYFESEAGQRKRFVEDNGFDDDLPVGGVSATGLIDQEFVPLIGGPFNRQMYLHDFLKMEAMAFQLVNHNALAAAAVKIFLHFILGRGISFHIKDDEARGVWEEFWERNRMRDKFRVMVRDMIWQGEMLLRYYEPKPGYTTLKVLDASSCWEVVTDPEDVDRVFFFHLQYPTPYQTFVTGNIPVSKYIIQQVPPTNMQHLKLNASAQERRGRSMLLPGMAELKRFKDFYNGQTVKALLEANLVWKVKVKGDQADVDAFLTNQAFTELPPPGGMWIENESVDLTVQSAQMTASRGSTGIGQQIASIFATSLNLPNEYFNIESGAAASRATALVRTDPAVKTIEYLQQVIKEQSEEMYDRVMSTALLAGRITRRAARQEPETRADGEMTNPLSLPPGSGSRPVRAQTVRLR
jgi:hypothetical protein